MKFIQLLIIGLAGSLQALSAQQNPLDVTVVQFDTLMKGEHDSMVVWVRNSQNWTVEVKDVNVYGWDFFYSGDTAFSIDKGDSAAVWVHFSPRHNIHYNGELVLYLKDLGSYRADLRGTGMYPGTYYSSTFGLYEEDLKQALKTRLAQGYVSLGYNTARDWIYMSIDNEKTNGQGATVNTIHTAYTGRKVEGYVNRSEAQSNGNLNTEHTYPQSKFNSSEPMQSDMFHLFVVDAGANSRRSNNPFGVVMSPSWTEGGAKYGNSIFEPRDEQKGVTARAMLYFALRYQNYDNFMNVAVPDGSGQNITQEALMRKWAMQFKPTEKDSLRNLAIYNLQKNRNPFIDHPEFLERIRFIGQNSTALQVRGFEVNVPAKTQITFVGETGDTLSYHLSITNTGNVLIPVKLAVKNGTLLDYPGLFNIDAGESYELDIRVIRHQAVNENDSLLISSSAIPGSELAYPLSIDVFTSSIGNPEEDRVAVYPNPASGLVRVELQDAVETRFELIDAKGAVITSTVLNQPLNEIPLPVQEPGVYFVRLTQGHRVIQRRLVIR